MATRRGFTSNVLTHCLLDYGDFCVVLTHHKIRVTVLIEVVMRHRYLFIQEFLPEICGEEEEATMVASIVVLTHYSYRLRKR